MSMTLEQKRASKAYGHVQEVSEADKDSYGAMVLKLPVLIRTAGLCQALHFLRSRKVDVIRDLLLQHLAEQLERVEPALANFPREAKAEELLKAVREAGLAQYLWLSREALATVEWYARLAQSELKMDPAAAEVGR